MNLYESSEDYLETILILSNKQESVRSIDIVEYLNFSKPSVSVAMKKLRENGYINVDKKGHITLTEEGLKVASKTYEKHRLLTDLFISIGVNKEIAEKDACRVEHTLSEETFEAIKKSIKK